MKFTQIIHLAEHYEWEFFENFRFPFSHFFFMLKKFSFGRGAVLMAGIFFIIFVRSSSIPYNFWSTKIECNVLKKLKWKKKHAFRYFFIINKGDIPIQSRILSQYMNKLKVCVKKNLISKILSPVVHLSNFGEFFKFQNYFIVL